MLYIGHFMHLTNQQEILETERRHGEFSLIVEADNLETAIGMFESRIVDFRRSKDFFQGDCRIFFVQLLELDAFPTVRAMMLNFKSTVGDPVLPYIDCIIPTEEADSCRIIDWEGGRPEVNGKSEKLFIEFKD